MRLSPAECAEHFTESGMLVGILHVNVLALDVDVYDADLSRVIVDEALRRFAGALERIGEAPKSALFFRMDEPGFKITNTEKHEKDGKTAQVEVRSVSRQIVVYGKHPVTHAPYRWPRGELWATPREALPVADRAEIERFRDWCNDRIRKWAGIEDTRVAKFELYPPRQDERPSAQAFREALRHVPAAVGYDDWLRGLMAIHDFYSGSAEGLGVAQDWSSPYPDYSPREVEAKWRSFEVGKGVSYKSIFHLAKLNGADMAAISRIDRPPQRDSFNFNAGSTAETSRGDNGEEKAGEYQPPPFDTSPLTRSALKGIPPRRWLYGHKLIRGFCTIAISPGGIGKSAWASAIAVDMAMGAATLHDQPHGKLKTWIYNLEDPRDETLRKIAALDLYKHLPDEAFDNIIVSSGRDRPLIVATEAQRGVYVATPDVALMIEALRAAKVDVLIVDPAVRAHRLPENDNKAVDVMMDAFAQIAHEADVAILLIHHSRKGFVGGDMDSARGASSMSSAARVALTLQTMQPEEASEMNIPEAERRLYIRIDNAKQNLAPPSEKAEWLKLESQNIANGDAGYPDGDFVQVVTRWVPPDAWADVGPKSIEIIDRLKRGYVREDGSTEPYSMAKKSGDRYVANAVLASFPTGEKSEKQALSIVRFWISKGILEERKYKNRNADERTGIFVVNEASGSGNE